MVDLKVVEGRITNPESERLEFKSCKKSLSKDFWPTYSALANTFGGTVIIGVHDETHEPIGIDDPDKIIKELWDLLNDGKKVNVNLLSPDDIRIINIDGKTLIQVDIPRAERRKRPVFINGTMENGTYKRTGEGDYHCTVSELKQMLRDSSETSQDSNVIMKLTMGDLDMQSVAAFRERMSKRNPSHPWNDRNDEDFLRLIGACASVDGTVHPTIAGLLMFGLDYSIMAELPNYHLDYLEFADGTDDWTFRITTGSGEFTGNVYTFLTEVSNRIILLNNRGKDIEGMSRIDDTSLIRAQRELLVNALVHADYAGLRGVRAEWRQNTFKVRNPGNLRIPLDEMFEGGISDPRNPHLALMIGLIGMAERAGSGVSDVVSYCRRHGIPDPLYTETTDPETVSVTLRLSTPSGSEGLKEAIREMMSRDPTISIDSIVGRTGVDRNKVTRTINSMKAEGIVNRVGGTRGHWVISGPMNGIQ